MCAATAATHAEVLVTVYFYHRTLRGLPHDELPTLEPGTRFRISARFMAPGHETPRARRGGAPPVEDRSPRSSGDVCIEPLRPEGSLETRGVPSSGVGPSQNGTCSGCGIARNCRAGRSTVFSVREDQSLYNASQSAPSGRMGSFGTEPQQTVVSWWLIEQNVFGGWYVSVARSGPGKVP